MNVTTSHSTHFYLKSIFNILKPKTHLVVDLNMPL